MPSVPEEVADVVEGPAASGCGSASVRVVPHLLGLSRFQQHSTRRVAPSNFLMTNTIASAPSVLIHPPCRPSMTLNAVTVD